MNVNDEYKWISHTFKGEVWEEAKKSLINDFGFIEVEGQHFKSPNTDVVYRFILRRDTDLFITRIDTMSDNRYASIEYSVSDRLNVLQEAAEKKRKEED